MLPRLTAAHALCLHSLLSVTAAPKPGSKRPSPPPADEPAPEDTGDTAEDLGANRPTNGGSKTTTTKKPVNPDTPPLVVPTIKAPRVPKCGKSAGGLLEYDCAAFCIWQLETWLGVQLGGAC